MSRQSQDQTNEKLHIEDAAAAQEEYSLEDIMNEFGGWSKKEAPAEKAPEPDAPSPEPEKTPAQDEAQTRIVRFPASAQVRGEPAKEPKPPKNPADFKGQTIRFTPIKDEKPPDGLCY